MEALGEGSLIQTGEYVGCVGRAGGFHAVHHKVGIHVPPLLCGTHRGWAGLGITCTHQAELGARRRRGRASEAALMTVRDRQVGNSIIFRVSWTLLFKHCCFLWQVVVVWGGLGGLGVTSHLMYSESDPLCRSWAPQSVFN